MKKGAICPKSLLNIFTIPFLFMSEPSHSSKFPLSAPASFPGLSKSEKINPALPLDFPNKPHGNYDKSHQTHYPV